ncbi:PLP-dependent aminotransferase family protein [Burkholderia sp. A1]|uniref:MocR-like pyridoxine biosynthesis transcription factor PdxR n=2 Tax=unclassified Burkholderia TaxID=2613784 RepID=UPI000ABAC41D|nr:PLP-dependent aminotransferase family protein [Burkholderia sp. A1]
MRDLLIELGETGPIRQRVVAGLYRALRDGRLRPGQRLPASRLWALELGVSRNTIREATAALVEAGWLESRAGSGLYVKAVPPVEATPSALVPSSPRSSPPPSTLSSTPSSPRPPSSGHAPAASPDAAAPPPLVALSRWAGRLPASAAMLEAVDDSTACDIDFRPGTVSADAQRLFGATRLARRHAGAEAASLTDYGDPSGDPRVREQLATYLRRSRGARCEADELVLTTGTHQSLDLLFRLLLDEGRTHATEDPGFPASARLARLAGARLHAIEVDREGLRVDTLPAGLSTLYCTPNHQFPLGVPLSAPRRAALLARAAADGFVILEDDYDCEFHHGAAPAPCLQSEDRDGRVVYLGSVAKLLAPALRIGYVVAPPWLRESLVKAKTVVDRQTSAHAQNALLPLLASGDFATHLRRMRREYGQRRARLLAAMRGPLARWLAPWATTCGLHLAASVRAGYEAAALQRLAASAGVAVHRASRFSIRGSAADVLVFGFGHLELARIDAGVERLARAWHAGLAPALAEHF